ncbi:MAG TPA: ISAs1 family transposase [Longimicrobium sp.]|nr:ISAs1 family transposase [Longimicrobium sp.]
MTILQAFDTIPEFRTAKGKRHDLSFVLTCLLLGSLSDCKSWRDHASFVHRHRNALLAHFRPPKDRLPSYSTLRRVALGLDFDALSEAFLTWAREHVSLEPGEWLAIDGKSLSGTSSHPGDARQNFTALVSLYAHKRGVVLQIDAYENKLESEAHIVEAILAGAQLTGAGVTADALHCRKKPAPSSARPVLTT